MATCVALRKTLSSNQPNTYRAKQAAAKLVGQLLEDLEWGTSQKRPLFVSGQSMHFISPDMENPKALFEGEIYWRVTSSNVDLKCTARSKLIEALGHQGENATDFRDLLVKNSIESQVPEIRERAIWAVQQVDNAQSNDE